VVYSNDVFEHLHPDDLAAHLADAYRILVPRGPYVGITPNRRFGPHDVSKHFLPQGAEPEGLHLREYTTVELARAFRDAGYERVRSLCFSARLTGLAGRLGWMPLVRPALRDLLERRLERSRLARRLLALETIMVVARR
jgi:hypothetical protein